VNGDAGYCSLLLLLLLQLLTSGQTAQQSLRRGGRCSRPAGGRRVNAHTTGKSEVFILVLKGRSFVILGPDLQNILRQSYDCLTTVPKLRSTYDGHLIYKASYEELKAFLRHDSRAKL